MSTAAAAAVSPATTVDDVHRSLVWRYVMGDCPEVSNIIDSLPSSLSRILRFLETILRTLGALVFVNNPWSGLFFAIAVFYHDPFASLVGLMGLMIAYLTACIINVDMRRLRSGVATFNGFMVAYFIAAQSAPKWNGWLILPALFFSMMSTLIKCAFHVLLMPYRLPALNLPFSLTTLCFLASQASQPNPTLPVSLKQRPVSQFNETEEQTYSATIVFQGIFYAIANPYGCPNTASVALAWSAVFIASPLLCVMCLIGSVTGTGVAIYLGVSASQLSGGMWSFNSLLVCGSVGGHFFVWSRTTALAAIFASAMATVVAGMLHHCFSIWNLPFQALPLFITDALVITGLSAYDSRYFSRVAFDDIRYAEYHWSAANCIRRRQVTVQKADKP